MLLSCAGEVKCAPPTNGLGIKAHITHHGGKGELCLLYKALCDNSPSLLSRMSAPPTHQPRTTRLNRRAARLSTAHPHQLQNVLPANSRNNVSRAFPYSVIPIWNQLPASIIPLSILLSSPPPLSLIPSVVHMIVSKEAKSPVCGATLNKLLHTYIHSSPISGGAHHCSTHRGLENDIVRKLLMNDGTWDAIVDVANIQGKEQWAENGALWHASTELCVA